MIEELVRTTILKHQLIQKGDYVIVGLSGGPDSVCLFSVLRKLKDEYNLSIFVVHVNHMLRPGAADLDQAYVEALCKETGTPCYMYTVDCNRIAKEQGITSEEAGRNARYDAFYETAVRIIDEDKIPAGSVKIAVAQNKNDQAETLLMRIIRGTGTDGLSGMEYLRTGKHGTSVIRPLLDVERKEIEEYCEKNNLQPRMDLTNAEPIYTRNKIRLNLIPYIENNFNENVVDALDRLSKIAGDDKEYLQAQAQNASQEASAEVPAFYSAMRAVSFDRLKLCKMAPAIRRRVIMGAFREIGLAQDITAAHIAAAEELIGGDKASAYLDFPKQFQMAVSYEIVTMLFKGEQNLSECNREVPANLSGIEGLKFFEIRTRRPGDRFTPKGMKEGSKKLQDYFVDQKIPKDVRDKILLVCRGNEVLWIMGNVDTKHSRMSEKSEFTEQTKNALMLEVQDKLW